jgi:serine/threonine protein kinase/Tfp pilus assembly protein PilF
MIGKNIAHYKIVEKLGGGGMGVVYRAEDTKLKRDVAIKVLSPGRSMSETDEARLIAEARSAAALRHPNICTVYEIGKEGDVSYISMAYVPGRRLDAIVEKGPLSVERALDIAIQIAQGLQAAHDKNIVHRDIKTANVIVDKDNRVTILDFGIAKLSGQAHTKEGSTFGTVTYMSPEQARGDSIDHRTDIWSLGVCLYEMLAGRKPFVAEQDAAVVYQILNQNPPDLADLGLGIPEPVLRIVDKALEKDLDNRYQLMEQMLADLKLAGIDRKSSIGTDGVIQPSIAVLPFTNMSADKEQDYFCDGIAEDIITSLSHIEGLRVAARTSSFALRDSGLDVRAIGRKLGVDTLLEGSVRKAGDRLRITAQLVSVSDGYHLWSERYDRDLQDVFAIQDEIGQNIVDALKIKLTEKEKRALSKVPTTDVEAYEYYIRGRQYFHQLGVKGLEYARNMFTSAIIRDPGYALAYCGLADCYSMIYTYYDSDRTNVENALTASRKALSLDSELAEAHASLGLSVSINGQYADAVDAFKKAIQLSPKLYEAYYFYARMMRSRGDLEEAARLFSEASAVRPEDYQAPILAGDTYRGLDRRDDMLAAFGRGLAVARKHLEFHPNDARAWYLGAHAHFELGAKEDALKWNERAMALSPDDAATLYNAACLFSVMGEREKCYECLDQAVEHGFAHPQWLENDPDFESIRGEDRFKKILAELESSQKNGK